MLQFARFGDAAKVANVLVAKVAATIAFVWQLPHRCSYEVRDQSLVEVHSTHVRSYYAHVHTNGGTYVRERIASTISDKIRRGMRKVVSKYSFLRASVIHCCEHLTCLILSGDD